MTGAGAAVPKRRTAAVRRQWGKAGVLLTSREVRALELRAERRQREAAAAEKAAHDAWARGHAVPYRITTALDIRKLYGPEVDLACGVEEPAVDMWEKGTLYPTWEQLLALAELTGFPVAFFTNPVRPEHVIRAADTSLRFHMRIDPDSDPEPVLRFTPEAIAATLGGYCVACHTPHAEPRPQQPRHEPRSRPPAAGTFEQTAIPLPGHDGERA